MTKKDYVAIAALLKHRRPNADMLTPSPAYSMWHGIAWDLCDVFASDNPRFDRARFLAACGVEQ